MRRNIEVPGLGHGGQPIPLATIVGPVLVTGGISGRDPQTGTVPEDPAQEVAQLFRNLRAVLDAAGCTADQVAKLTVFVKDREIRSYVNPEWVAMFPTPVAGRHGIPSSRTSRDSAFRWSASRSLVSDARPGRRWRPGIRGRDVGP